MYISVCQISTAERNEKFLKIHTVQNPISWRFRMSLSLLCRGGGDYERLSSGLVLSFSPMR